MLSGSEIALLDGALIAKALRAFEEQLHALAAAQTANCIGITCQIVLLLDDRFTGLASPFVPDENQGSGARGQGSVCPDPHPLTPYLHSSPLRRPASIMRNRRYVANRSHLNARRR